MGEGKPKRKCERPSKAENVEAREIKKNGKSKSPAALLAKRVERELVHSEALKERIERLERENDQLRKGIGMEIRCFVKKRPPVAFSDFTMHQCIDAPKNKKRRSK
jgi:hypothetical protein